MKAYNWENKISMDPCALHTKSRENEGIIDYVTYNFYTRGDYAKTKEQLDAVAWENQNLRYRQGYGIAGSETIDTDTTFKYKSEVTHGPEKRQYYIRNFTAVPNFARGTCAPNTESILINGLDTSPHKTCERLTEKDFNRFVPYVDCFQKFIEAGAQNLPSVQPIGVNTRELMRNKCEK